MTPWFRSAPESPLFILDEKYAFKDSMGYCINVVIGNVPIGAITSIYSVIASGPL
jgi:hypothetical protein